MRKHKEIIALGAGCLMATVLCFDACTEEVRIVSTPEVTSLLVEADGLVEKEQYQDALVLQHKAVAVAQSKEERWKAELEIAETNILRERFDLAEPILRKIDDAVSTETLPSAEHQYIRFQMLNLLADVCRNTDRNGEAVRNRMIAARIAKKLGDFDNYYYCRARLLRYEAKQGNFITAIEGWMELDDECKAGGRHELHCEVLNELINIFITVGNLQQADKYLQELRETTQNDALYSAAADILEHRMAVMTGNLEKQALCVERLKHDLRENTGAEFNYYIRGQLAEYYARTDQQEERREIIDDMFGNLQDYDNETKLAYIHMLKAEYLMDNGMPDSVAVLVRGNDFRKVYLSIPLQKARFYELQSRYYMTQRRFKDAYGLLNKASVINDSIEFKMKQTDLAYRNLIYQRDAARWLDTQRRDRHAEYVESKMFSTSLGINLLVAAMLLVTTLLLLVQLIINKHSLSVCIKKTQSIRNELDVQSSYIETQRNELSFKQETIRNDTRNVQAVLDRAFASNDKRLDECPYVSSYFSLSSGVGEINGDFYVVMRSNKKLFIAVADATGHNTPTALISLTTATLLGQVLAETDDDTPAHLLGLLDVNFRAMMAEIVSVRSIDRVDMTLMRIDEETGLVDISTARQKATLAPAESNRAITEIHGVKRGIGETSEVALNNYFHNTIVDMRDGDTIFLSTDGLYSLIGANGQKITSSVLRPHLQVIAAAAPDTQREKLASFIDSWKGENTQPDDLLVLAIKYKSHDSIDPSTTGV